MEFARVRDEPGFDTGLTYQVSADVRCFSSLVWNGPFVMLFYGTLLRADPRFDLCGVCEFPSASWIGVARSAEETEDRLRSEREIPADIVLLGSGELGRLLKNMDVRHRLTEALQLTSWWLREAADRHPALTFYGA